MSGDSSYGSPERVITYTKNKCEINSDLTCGDWVWDTKTSWNWAFSTDTGVPWDSNPDSGLGVPVKSDSMKFSVIGAQAMGPANRVQKYFSKNNINKMNIFD